MSSKIYTLYLAIILSKSFCVRKTVKLNKLLSILVYFFYLPASFANSNAEYPDFFVALEFAPFNNKAFTIFSYPK